MIKFIRKLFRKRRYKINTSKLKRRLLCTDFDGELKEVSKND